MRSRFWLGDVDASPKDFIGKLLTPLMNNATLRKRKIPDHLGHDLMLHSSKEMHHLAKNFTRAVPSIWAKIRQTYIIKNL